MTNAMAAPALEIYRLVSGLASELCNSIPDLMVLGQTMHSTLLASADEVIE
jgi:hypothetical protein